MKTHGMNRTPEHRSWLCMISRCYHPGNTTYHRYGGRGITVCDRWRGDFTAFLADMGAKPSLQHSIDRIDNDGNYEPGNCRWATRKEQVRNRSTARRVTFRGLTLGVTEWAERTGISKATIKERLNAGWTVEDALTRPLLPKIGARVLRGKEASGGRGT